MYISFKCRRHIQIIEMKIQIVSNLHWSMLNVQEQLFLISATLSSQNHDFSDHWGQSWFFISLHYFSVEKLYCIKYFKCDFICVLVFQKNYWSMVKSIFPVWYEQYTKESDRTFKHSSKPFSDGNDQTVPKASHQSPSNTNKQTDSSIGPNERYCVSIWLWFRSW